MSTRNKTRMDEAKSILGEAGQKKDVAIGSAFALGSAALVGLVSDVTLLPSYNDGWDILTSGIETQILGIEFTVALLMVLSTAAFALASNRVNSQFSREELGAWGLSSVPILAHEASPQVAALTDGIGGQFVFFAVGMVGYVYLARFGNDS